MLCVFNPIELRTATTLLRFGCSECNRVNEFCVYLYPIIHKIMSAMCLHFFIIFKVLIFITFSPFNMVTLCMSTLADLH